MKKYSVLITGGGGREAALVKAYARSPKVKSIFIVPGNELMQTLSSKKIIIFPHLLTTDIKKILTIIQENGIDFVDICQDNAVEAGLGDILSKNNISHIGPSRRAGRIEWDKAWSREFMSKNNIPHPLFKVCHSYEDGMEFLNKNKDQPWVVKASGLAEGKGVIVAKNRKESVDAIEKIQSFGAAGSVYLLEQMLIGEEFSVFALSDGKTYQIIGSAQDHKRVNDKDEGLNTGGMGCISSPLVLTRQKIRDIKLKILDKTFLGLKNLNAPYKGILYLGGIITKQNGIDKIYVIEFNARWGDPECQAILPGIKSDFFDLSRAVADQRLKNLRFQTDKKVRVVVAGTSRGYPADYSSVKGKEVYGLESAKKIKGVEVFCSGIKRVKGRDYAQAGRLFYIVGEGRTVIDARKKAYEAMTVMSVEGNNLHFRTDIGWRDVQRIYDKV